MREINDDLARLKKDFEHADPSDPNEMSGVKSRDMLALFARLEASEKKNEERDNAGAMLYRQLKGLHARFQGLTNKRIATVAAALTRWEKAAK